MTTIDEPSFEILNPWGIDSNFSASTGAHTTWKTDGTQSIYIRLNNGSHSAGTYVWSTQIIYIDSDFDLTFDFNVSAAVGYNKTMQIRIDDNIEYQSNELGGIIGQHLNNTISISGYTGQHVLKIGIWTHVSSIGTHQIEVDNLRITNEIFTNFYVRSTGGNDSNSGTSWANAWATIDHAANTITDGKTLHIGFGTYSNEPTPNDIAPVNIGSTGIKYLPETEVTGGGTGSVIIEVN